MRRLILVEIREVNFYSLQVDTTTVQLLLGKENMYERMIEEIIEKNNTHSLGTRLVVLHLETTHWTLVFFHEIHDEALPSKSKLGVFWLTRWSNRPMTNLLTSREENPDVLVAALLRRLYGCLRCSLQVLVVDDKSTCFPIELALFLMRYGLSKGFLVVHDVAAPSLGDVSVVLFVFFNCRADAEDLFFRLTS
ncbi:hypothetical protein TNIN_299971 [Trichonephila inaurata madagascariensis]|uniref:Uncharacterized protein n=1 Tax=Trichonephila inaurata madagascariensis TaxID=2747483 RepID=A0A8X7BYY7_9ARAC|nr:hypothetical protein TNIN_299971 [Trichonephila inaurata madagascariensis]